MASLYILGAFVISSFMFLCFYTISHFYYDFYVLVRDMNLNDEIMETIDMVNEVKYGDKK